MNHTPTQSRKIFLLRKYIKNECSRAETNELLTLMRHALSDKETDVIAFSLWKAVAKKSNQSAQKEEDAMRTEAAAIVTAIGRKRPKSHRWRNIGSVAAAAAILVVVALSLRPHQTDIAQTAAAHTHETHSTFASADKMKRLTLADGSVVHLNTHTTIRLRQGRFNAHTREVWLDEGEAFFEVAKDAARPFIVHTANGMSTRVLGTSFNVQAYAQLDNQVVSVKTGRVQVDNENGGKMVLEPNFQATFNPKSLTFSGGKTDGRLIGAWREGKLVFQRASPAEIAFRLKQHYGVELIYADAQEFENVQFSSVFAPHTPIGDIAQTIARIYGVHYKITDNKLILN